MWMYLGELTMTFKPNLSSHYTICLQAILSSGEWSRVIMALLFPKVLLVTYAQYIWYQNNRTVSDDDDVQLCIDDYDHHYHQLHISDDDGIAYQVQ